ncbi:MAG: helix-turn-helix transcriptional regulator [Clostridia bacterium]|nr:helix-turn-helix transcriptional regulator [Clostridia bacterium]
MFNNIENLKLLSSSNGITRDYNKIENKKNHSFIFRTVGEGVYITKNKTHVIREGEMAFLPRGSSYEFKRTSEVPCEYMSISFQGDIDGAEIRVFNMDNFTDNAYILNHFPTLLKLGSESEKYKCYSLFYSILSYISSIENAEYSAKIKADVIEPALKYLKENIFSPNLRIDSLHLMCGISDTYFRRIFVSKFGVPPKEYVIGARISHAMDIIESASFRGVTDLALSVGYTDPLYFSRAFKKKYGVSPSRI